MRTVGRRSNPLPAALPTAEAVRRAAIHQAAGQAVAALPGTGVVCGVYRFKSHADADAQKAEALARVMAANAALQKKPPTKR